MLKTLVEDNKIREVFDEARLPTYVCYFLFVFCIICDDTTFLYFNLAQRRVANFALVRKLFISRMMTLLLTMPYSQARKTIRSMERRNLLAPSGYTCYNYNCTIMQDIKILFE